MRSTKLLVLLLLLSVFSCKKLKSISSSKHTWGETTRNVPGFSYTSCRTDPAKDFPKTQKFLIELIRHIMEHNPETFKLSSALDPKNFCVTVKYSSVANAGTNIVDRSILVYTALVEQTENLHEIAYLMGHELAHITMKHTEITHPNYVPTSKYLEIKALYDLAIDQVIPDNFNQSLHSWTKCLNSFPLNDRKTIYSNIHQFP